MVFRTGWIDDPDLGVRVLVLNDIGMDETLELQRGYEAAADGQASDEDTCCLVRNGAASVYGGVETFSLSGTRLTSTLTPEAAKVLVLPRVVAYELDPEGLLLLAQRLPEILD